jgi:hypothetical protein
MNIETNYLSNNGITHYNLENMIYNVMEVSNLYPNNLQKRNIRSDQRQLIIHLRSEAHIICRDSISPEYKCIL